MPLILHKISKIGIINAIMTLKYATNIKFPYILDIWLQKIVWKPHFSDNQTL